MASKAFRRGTVRLRSTLGGGHTTLNLVISEQSSVRQRHKNLITAEASAAETLHKWSQLEESAALQDILHQTSELTIMWTQAERDYIAARKEFKKKFEQILEMEKRLDHAKKQLATCEERERKLQRELVKAPKDASTVQEKLRQATDAKDLADAEVEGQSRETEALKLLAVRAGLLDQSAAWNALGRKCCLLADCQKELAQQVPEVHPRDQELPTYTGARETTRIMQAARAQIDQLQPPSYASGMTTSLPASRSASRPSSAGVRKSSQLRPRSLSEHDLPELAAGLRAYEDDSFDSFDSDP